MKRPPRITKREKKAMASAAPSAQHDHHHEHIHCTACGKHLEVEQFDPPATARWVKCAHGTPFASCVECEETTKKLLAEHDRTGKPVQFAPSFH